MPEILTEDATLHVEVDGAGAPVAVVAHGLTNSCGELAALTPLMPGTQVRFCFRGHGHSSSPERGYRFADFGRDVVAVADAYGATVAMGTSLGAGAITHVVANDPDRFEKLRTQIKPEPGGFEDIPWMTNLWEARRKAAAEGKPMYVWSGGGPPCGFT